MKTSQRARLAWTLVLACAVLGPAAGLQAAQDVDFLELRPGMRREAVLEALGGSPSSRGRAGEDAYLVFPRRIAGRKMLLLCFFREGRLGRAVAAVQEPLERKAGEQAYEDLAAAVARRLGPPEAEKFWTPSKPKRRGIDGPGRGEPGPFSLFSRWRRKNRVIRAFVRGEGERVEAGVEIVPAGNDSGRGQQGPGGGVQGLGH
jgi:hypothetical protein